MSKEGFAELHDAPAVRALEPLLAASMARCAERPEGIQNDWANRACAPWLTPGSVRCPTLLLHDRADTAVPIEHDEWPWTAFRVPVSASCTSADT